MALGQAPALAATIPVDGSTCTLVDAITAANTDAPTGGCLAGSGADTLTLTNSSVHTLTSVSNTTFGPTGLPVVSSTITIEGHGSTIKRDSADPDQFRIFAINSGGNLTLNETTVSGGLATGGDVPAGGGVYNGGGTATLTNSTVSGNSAYSGGGVFNDNTSYVTLTNSTVSGNSAGFRGGGVFNRSATLNLANTILANSPSGGDCANDAGALRFRGQPGGGRLLRSGHHHG